MNSKEYRKILFIMIVIGILTIPVLYMLSDSREQAVKEVENEFNEHLFKDAKRLKEIKKEPSFHGDGEAAILLSVSDDDISNIEEELAEYEVSKDSEEYEHINSAIKMIRDRGFETEIENQDKIYFKETTEYKFSNFIGLIIDKENKKTLFVKYDS